MTKVCIVCRENVLTQNSKPDMPLVYTMYQSTDILVTPNGETAACAKTPIRYVCEECRHDYRGDWLTVGEPKLGDNCMFKMEKNEYD